MVQAPNTMLADVDLPEMDEDPGRADSDSRAGAAGGVASKAAADIERAAAQVGRLPPGAVPCFF